MERNDIELLGRDSLRCACCCWSVVRIIFSKNASYFLFLIGGDNEKKKKDAGKEGKRLKEGLCSQNEVFWSFFFFFFQNFCSLLLLLPPLVGKVNGRQMANSDIVRR